MTPSTRLKRCSVDWPLLARDLYAACRQRRVSLSEVDREIGVNRTELSNLRHGTAISAAALASLLAWLYPDDIPAWIRVPNGSVTAPTESTGEVSR